MRALFLLFLVLTACTTPPRTAASPTPSPAASLAATPTQTSTSSPSASRSPIVLPSTAQLSAPSGIVIWALVGGTRLFRSTNRGDTWDERALPRVADPQSFAFVNEREGFLLVAGAPGAVCGSGTPEIWRTADAAGTWDKVTFSGITDPCTSDIAAASSTEAFLNGLDQSKAAVVYRTQDGGLNWRVSNPLPAAPALSTTAGLTPHRVRVIGSVLLMDATAGSPVFHFVFRSTDRAASWSYVATAPASTEGNIAFVTPSRWITLGAPGAAQETTDSGATWHPYATDYSQAAPIAPDIVFADAMVGYATVRGAIQRTTDGGAHWTPIKTPGT